MRRFLCLSFVLFSSLAARAQYNDSVNMTTGKAMEGEVQKLSYKEITILLPGTSNSTVTVQKEQILGEIAWDDSSVPPAMLNGKSLFAGNKFPEAAVQFGKALAAPGTRGVLKQECAFRLAESHRMNMNFTEASKAYQKLLTDFPETFYIKEVYNSVVDCYMFASPPDFINARKAIADISAKAKDLNLSEDFIGDMKLKDGKMYERQNQFPQAQGVYSSLTTHKTPRIQWAANAGLGACLLAAKDFDKAKSAFQKVVDSADRSQSASLSRAYNGLGECLLAADVSKAENVKEALLCFLRSVTLYLPGPSDLTDDHAKAMFLSARCFHTLAELETNPEQKEKNMMEFQKLAARFNDTYGPDYPDWAKKVKEPLGK
ncbi:MAG: tetratricopeptide repeat protein [Planctomycetes bacterium]|nr:tetratricopeptide repeat protein [Planctomycetota bacterium]